MSALEFRLCFAWVLFEEVAHGCFYQAYLTDIFCFDEPPSKYALYGTQNFTNGALKGVDYADDIRSHVNMETSGKHHPPDNMYF